LGDHPLKSYQTGAREFRRPCRQTRRGKYCDEIQLAQEAITPSYIFTYPQNSNVPTAAPSIRTVDFANLSYPWAVRINSKWTTTALQLRSGQTIKQGTIQDNVSLGQITYGHIAGDDSDDAVVILDVKSRDRSWTSSVFLFTLRSGLVVLLAKFEAGFTLRRVAAENGQLIVEADEIGDAGMCCPVGISKSRYKWAAGRFVQVGEIERHLFR